MPPRADQPVVGALGCAAVRLRRPSLLPGLGLLASLGLLLGLLTALPQASAAEPVALPAEITSAQLPSDAELADCWARVLLRANPGPFQYLAYEVTDRGAAGVVTQVRGFMGRSDVVTRTELLPKGELRRLFGYLRDLGALQLPAVLPREAKPSEPAPIAAAPLGKTAPKTKAALKAKAKRSGILELAGWDYTLGPPQSAEPIYELSFRLGGRENTVLLASPFGHADGRYGRFIQVLRDLAVRSTGEIPYHPPLGSAGVAGYLFIDAVPSAVVTVDGTKLTDTTPIFAYAVAPGSHTVVLENTRLGLRREVKVKVQAGMTTSVQLELQ